MMTVTNDRFIDKEPKEVGPDKHGKTFKVGLRHWNSGDFYPCHGAFNPNTNDAKRAVVDQYTARSFTAFVVWSSDRVTKSPLAIDLQTFDAYGSQWEAYFGKRRVSGTGGTFEWVSHVFSTVDGRREEQFDSEGKARRFLSRFESLLREYPSLLINPDDWGAGYALNNGVILTLRRLLAGVAPTVTVLP